MSLVYPSPLIESTPFDDVAENYDHDFTHSLIGRAQRHAVWAAMDRHFLPGSRILEINCGTGEDALHLASRGISVLACDASPRMIEVAQKRARLHANRGLVAFRTLPTERISELEGDGSAYDGVLSNFAGLNCIEDLESAASSVGRLVRPGGKVLLCLFGRYCVWEWAWYGVRGDYRKATRRMQRAPQGARIGPDRSIVIRYPTVGHVRQAFAPQFRMIGMRGISVAVPPSYLERLARRHPLLIHAASAVDKLFGRVPGVKSLADHVLLIFERRPA